MNPVLSYWNMLDRENMGYGEMAETISCKTTEDLQGLFELEMEYPVDGYLADYIKVDMVISAYCGKSKPQLFTIVNVRKSTDGVMQIRAEHTSYGLMWRIVKPTPYFYGTLQEIVDRLYTNAYAGAPFWLTGTGTEKFSVETEVPENMKTILLRLCEEKNLDLVITDNFDVEISEKKTIDSIDPKIESGKNLVYFSEENDGSEIIAGYAPYLKIGDEMQLYDVFQSDYFEYGDQKIVPFDMSTVGFGEGGLWPDLADVKSYFDMRINNLNLLGRHSVSAKYVDLDTSHALRDKVSVFVPQLKVDMDLRVVKRVFDVLKERNESVEIGDPVQDLITFLAKR